MWRDPYDASQGGAAIMRREPVMWEKRDPKRPRVRVERLTETAVLPKYTTAGAVGLDLHSDAPSFRLHPGANAYVRTGLLVAIPAGYEGQVRPRSGLAARAGVTVLNSPGTIDSDYRGELAVLLVNHGHVPVTIAQGDRIAQLVIAPVAHAVVIEEPVGEHETARGAGGFGSTGR